jgi:hypothetical protein
MATDCQHQNLPYPRARCVSQRCIAEVVSTEPPREREARRQADLNADAVANLSGNDTLKITFALKHLGENPEVGKLHVPEISRFLEHATPFVQAAAADALLKLTTPARARAADLHVRALDSFGGLDAEPHAQALAAFRDQGERIAPAIVQMLNTSRTAIPTALLALRELAGSAKGVAPSLVALAVGGTPVFDELERGGAHHKALLETICAIAPSGSSAPDGRVSCKPPTLVVSPD